MMIWNFPKPSSSQGSEHSWNTIPFESFWKICRIYINPAGDCTNCVSNSVYILWLSVMQKYSSEDRFKSHEFKKNHKCHVYIRGTRKDVTCRLKVKAKAKVAQSCPTLWEPVDCSPWNSLGQNSGVGSLCLLQGIFPTQGLNSGLPHCRRFLYQLSHKGSPRILEWVAYPFSRVSSWPRNWTGVSCIASGFFTNWAMKEACIGYILQFFAHLVFYILRNKSYLWTLTLNKNHLVLFQTIKNFTTVSGYKICNLSGRMSLTISKIKLHFILA